jgi:hypothetical protein
MRPQLFDLQFGPFARFIEREHAHANGEPIGDIRVHCHGDFAAPALRFQDAS